MCSLCENLNGVVEYWRAHGHACGHMMPAGGGHECDSLAVAGGGRRHGHGILLAGAGVGTLYPWPFHPLPSLVPSTPSPLIPWPTLAM
jgi:hypothetical protein